MFNFELFRCQSLHKKDIARGPRASEYKGGNTRAPNEAGWCRVMLPPAAAVWTMVLFTLTRAGTASVPPEHGGGLHGPRPLSSAHEHVLARDAWRRARDAGLCDSEYGVGFLDNFERGFREVCSVKSGNHSAGAVGCFSHEREWSVHTSRNPCSKLSRKATP